MNEPIIFQPGVKSGTADGIPLVIFRTPARTLIQHFANDYYQWVKRGAVKNDIFNRSVGLCSSMNIWLDRYAASEHVHEARRVFREEFGIYQYPFGGFVNYMREMTTGTMHHNRLRLNWAKRVAAGDYDSPEHSTFNKLYYAIKWRLVKWLRITY